MDLGIREIKRLFDLNIILREKQKTSCKDHDPARMFFYYLLFIERTKCLICIVHIKLRSQLKRRM
ncbi:MAG: hypothetical protein EGQ98_01740, partial [Clostridium sp.]|nr:hypothetical protein [Clostridium sp.]